MFFCLYDWSVHISPDPFLLCPLLVGSHHFRLLLLILFGQFTSLQTPSSSFSLVSSRHFRLLLLHPLWSVHIISDSFFFILFGQFTSLQTPSSSSSLVSSHHFRLLLLHPRWSVHITSDSVFSAFLVHPARDISGISVCCFSVGLIDCGPFSSKQDH